MNKNNIIIAKKYATAFFNLYSSEINEQVFWNIKSARLFLEKNDDILLYFSLPNIPLVIKAEGINLFLKKLNLLEEFKNLMILLIKGNRVFLFKEILRSLCLIFQEKTNTILFKITSSYSLREDDLKLLGSFLCHKTGKKIISQYKVDKNLIAGIRMQSSTLLWEYSVRKQLHKAKQSLIDR